MNASDVSIEELQSRLVTFSQQLENIHQLLESDPDNDEFLQIAKDLVEVIRLTKEMIDLKLSSTAESQPSAAIPEEKPVRHTTRDADDEVRHDMEEVEPLRPVLSFSPGTCCEAKSNDIWYPAYIESTTNKNTFNVHFLGFGTKQELDESNLRAIEYDQVFARDQLTPGVKCEAKYYVDGQFYSCVLEQVTAYGVKVLFDGYGNQEEVPLEYLRALTEPSVAIAASSQGDDGLNQSLENQSQKQKSKRALSQSSSEPKMIKIPDHLQILPTDTEAEQERKRRRIRAINNLNRQKSIEIERNQKQQGWKAFQTKARKKGVKGASGVLSKRGESIFASPDTVAGRVGVVGSGQGMTTFQDTRKKLKSDVIGSKT